MSHDERTALLETIREHRGLFLATTDGISDEQARTRSTVSELTIGGLVKHVTATEAEWMDFIRRGAVAFGEDEPVDWENIDWADPPAAVLARIDGFTMREDETLADLLEAYRVGAAEADTLLMDLHDLGVAHELPPAPWFPPGTAWSARRVFLHMLAETAQHAGHADIVREAIDGQKTMG